MITAPVGNPANVAAGDVRAKMMIIKDWILGNPATQVYIRLQRFFLDGHKLRAGRLYDRLTAGCTESISKREERGIATGLTSKIIFVDGQLRIRTRP